MAVIDTEEMGLCKKFFYDFNANLTGTGDLPICIWVCIWDAGIEEFLRPSELIGLERESYIICFKICMSRKVLKLTNWWKNLKQKDGKVHLNDLETFEQLQQQHLSVVWFGVQQTVVKEAIGKWRKHLRACVRAYGHCFEYHMHTHTFYGPLDFVRDYLVEPVPEPIWIFAEAGDIEW